MFGVQAVTHNKLRWKFQNEFQLLFRKKILEIGFESSE